MVFWCKGFFILYTLSMTDPNRSDTEEKTQEIETIESVFQSRTFPSDEEVRKLYESEILLGVSFSPISLTHYISNDDRVPEKEENSDLKGALEEQIQMFTLFLADSREEKQKELVATIQSPAGWKEIASDLKDPTFGRKSLEYVRKRKTFEMERENGALSKSLEETEKLLENNLKIQNNGA